MGRLAKRLADMVFTLDKTNFVSDIADADSVTFFPPATFTGTITLDVAPTAEPVESDFVTLQSAGADVNLTGGKGLVLTDVSFLALRLKSTVSETNKKVSVVIQRSA